MEKEFINKEFADDIATLICGVKQFVAYLKWKTEQYLYCDILYKVLCGVSYSMNRVQAFEDIVMGIGNYFGRKSIGDALTEWQKYNITMPYKDGEETYRMISYHFVTRQLECKIPESVLVELFWDFPLHLLNLIYGIGCNCENINEVKNFVEKYNIKIEKITK